MKTKLLKVSVETHKKIKKFCVKMDVSMIDFVDQIMSASVDKLTKEKIKEVSDENI